MFSSERQIRSTYSRKYRIVPISKDYYRVEYSYITTFGNWSRLDFYTSEEDALKGIEKDKNLNDRIIKREIEALKFRKENPIKYIS